MLTRYSFGYRYTFCVMLQLHYCATRAMLCPGSASLCVGGLGGGVFMRRRKKVFSEAVKLAVCTRRRQWVAAGSARRLAFGQRPGLSAVLFCPLHLQRGPKVIWSLSLNINRTHARVMTRYTGSET